MDVLYNNKTLYKPKSIKITQLLKKVDLRFATINGNNVEITSIFDEVKRVYDAFRYQILKASEDNEYKKVRLSFKSEIFSLSKFNDQITEKATSDKFVLIAESPDKYEYTDDEYFRPIGPAQGNTGTRIDRYILDFFNYQILPKLDVKADTYDLIICNPVQFQTSLYEIYKNHLEEYNTVRSGIRNGIWNGLFRIFDHKDNFLTRINSYIPRIIINACTYKFKSKLNCLLKSFNESHPDCVIFESKSHPSYWTSTTKIKRIFPKY